MTIQQSMAQHSMVSTAQSRRQSGVTPAHTHTVDVDMNVHTLLNDVNNKPQSAGSHSQCSSLTRNIDVMNNGNAHSLMEQSEVPFNPAALARARQAGWNSQPCNADAMCLMTPDDILGSTMQAQQARAAAAAPVGFNPSLQTATPAPVGHRVDARTHQTTLTWPVESNAYT